MKLFHPSNRDRSQRNREIYAWTELVYTIVDFVAAFSFVVGSILFFWESTQTAATWFFVVGSVCFALKPTIRFGREIRYLSLGDEEDLAKRARS